jgi:hypothetical protein
MDPQFPGRLLEAGYKRIVDCVQYMYEDFTKRQLTKPSDRAVAFRGVEKKIARAVSSEAYHGILSKYLHRMLLWQRSEGATMERINYAETRIPSWSWQALSGSIEFAVPGTSSMEWLKDISISTTEQHLEVELATFQGVTIVRTGLRHAIFDDARSEVGWIRYDQDRSDMNFPDQRFVLLGEESFGGKGFGLMVEPTTTAGGFNRIGIASADTRYLSRLHGRVRIV